MATDKTGYEGIHADPPSPDERRRWTVTIIPGWLGLTQHGVRIELNGTPVGILSLPKEEDAKWIKTLLEEAPRT